MAIIEKARCKITSINSQGVGIGYNQNGIIQVPYTIAGELVEFERHVYRREHKTILSSIIEYSPKRINPECKYFSACGGCALQHLSLDEYKKFKVNLLSNEHKKVSNDLLIVGKSSRRRINLKALHKGDKIFLGYHRFKSNQIINIDSCIVATKVISDLIPSLKNFLSLVLSSGQKAEVFLTEASNGLDVSIESSSDYELGSIKQDDLADFLSNNVIQLNLHGAGNIHNLINIDTPYLSFDDIPVKISSKSFLQPTKESDYILNAIILGYINKYYDWVNNNIILDLFCGRGTYSIPLSKYFSVYSYDNDYLSIEELENIRALYGLRININNRDLFDNPLNSKELAYYGLVLLNPPRAGAEAQVSNLSTEHNKIVIYISCNPETFMRDEEIMLSKGYKLKEITPLDQFYWSCHLELVAVFIA